MYWEAISAYLAQRRATQAEKDGDTGSSSSAGNTTVILADDRPITYADATRSAVASGFGSVTDTMRERFDTLPVGRISIILLIILFIVFAIQPVANTGQTRLALLFLSLTGRAGLTFGGGGGGDTSGFGFTDGIYSGLVSGPTYEALPAGNDTYVLWGME